MRNIIFNIFFVILTCSIYGQSGSFIIHSDYNDGAVKLRWSFDNTAVFDSFRLHGITIKRQIFAINNNILPFAQQTASQVTLVTGLKPKSRQWMEQNLSGDNANALIKLLYDNLGSDQINFASPKLKDAAMKEKVDKMNFFMTVFVAGQEFILAEAAGLGFIDKNAKPNHEYRYILTLTDPNGKNIAYPDYYNVKTFQSSSYTMPEIKGENGYSLINIKWTPNDKQQFTSYDIYRSPGGANSFVKINENPFVFMKMTGTEGNKITFQDSLPPNTTWDYKVQGLTPFGSISDFSNIVNVKSLVKPMLGFPLSPDTIIATANDVLIEWKMPDSLNTYITHFNIYRSIYQDDAYSKINQSHIASSLREYMDNDPVGDAFYIVEAISNDNNFYRTVPLFAQLIDSIPPVAPKGLTGQYLGSSKVELTWIPNTEEDIMGYRVMISDTRNGNYIQITNDAVTSASYTTQTESADPRDSTYFRIFAVDQKGNYSEVSEPFGLKKPNIAAPASPALTVVKPGKKGINLHWKYSSSVDVVKHILQRKMKGTPDWGVVMEIDSSEESSFMPTDSTEYNYLDTAALEMRPYEYRFIAQNEFYTQASSTILEVTPMTEIIAKNNIKNFEIEEEIVPPSLNPEVVLQISNLRRANPEAARQFGEPENIHNIILKWTYKLDPTVQDFQIFRSITGGATTLYRTITIAEVMGLDPNTNNVEITEDMGPTDLSIIDKNLLKGRRYTYQILARHKDQTTTPLSNSLTLKLEK